MSSFLMETLRRKPVQFKAGIGPILVSEDNQEYIDFFTDVGTASLGYAGPEQQAVLQRMIDGLIPVHAPNLYDNAERDRAASRLCTLTGMERVFFCNSGAEAAEAAIKLARKHAEERGRSYHVYSYAGGFHGRTYGALAAGDGPSYHYKGFGPMPYGFWHFKEIHEIPVDAAAVIMSPVFGNNDVRPYPLGWLGALRDFTRRNGIALIFDEVQTGAGRTGHVTYAQKVEIEPDIVTLAKGVAMGCPVGAVLARGDVANAFTPGSHFSTFGGNPIGMAFLNGMLDWLSNPANLEQVNQRGQYIRWALENMEWPKNVRGEGMLIAFDLDRDGLRFAEKCFQRNLLIGAFRPGPGPVKITPPLNCPQHILERGLGVINTAYKG